jgi:hypothetical protein
MDIVSRQRINILIHLADIQSAELTSPEGKLIHRVAEECNFPKPDLDTLIASPEPIGSFGALSQSQKKQYMYNICELMALVELSNQKKLLCQRVGYDLEYDNNQINTIIDQFQSELNSTQSKDGLLTDQMLVNSVA